MSRQNRPGKLIHNALKGKQHISFLANVFVDDLSVCCRLVSTGCGIDDIVIYPDDTALLASSPAALQTPSHNATRFTSVRGLVVNMKKIKCMSIKPKYDCFICAYILY